jgi:hypothetical protein
VSPDGGISVELHASQVLAEPADTQAPEAYLASGLEFLDKAARARFGVAVMREVDGRQDLIVRTHRFRALDEAGLFALAKDIARLTADSLDATALQRIVSPPKGERWGSLKSLEKVLASVSTEPLARRTMGPLVGAYELRHGDAHLKGDLQAAVGLAGIDSRLPYVHQGAQLLENCVTALWTAGQSFT